jgi:hypothetical protein
MAIEVTKLARKETRHGAVTFDPSLFNTGLARKVYAVHDDSFVFQTEAHSHELEQTLCLLQGADAWLAHCDPRENRIVHLKLEEGQYYLIPSNVIHQLRVKGQFVLETYMPRTLAIEWLLQDRKPTCRKHPTSLFPELEANTSTTLKES